MGVLAPFPAQVSLASKAQRKRRLFWSGETREMWCSKHNFALHVILSISVLSCRRQSSGLTTYSLSSPSHMPFPLLPCCCYRYLLLLKPLLRPPGCFPPSSPPANSLPYPVPMHSDLSQTLFKETCRLDCRPIAPVRPQNNDLACHGGGCQGQEENSARTGESGRKE